MEKEYCVEIFHLDPDVATSFNRLIKEVLGV